MAEKGLNFYEILRVDPKADLREIIVAIKKMRKFDKHGSYAATINRIEEILTDHKKRAVYDRENGFVEGVNDLDDDLGFLDIDVDTFETHYSQQQNYKHDIRQELEKKSSLNAQSQHGVGSMRRSINFGRVVIFFVLLLAVLVGVVFSKPMLEKYKAEEQVASAVNEIHNAEEQVENYIRENAIFPDDLSLISSNSNYQLTLDGDNLRIVLRFQGDVVDDLQGAEITSTFVTKPNLTEWLCEPGQYFPTDLTIKGCY